ncbi:MAG: hypothetical protein E7174_02265 [Firmicutes bacterium]|nr:hypothetical protein [Bacillota bacterium]
MKINGIEINAKKFAYDRCHKIYLLEDLKDEEDASYYDYEILNIKDLADTYKNSCSLRFISNWKLDKVIVKQFEDAIFSE